MKNGLAVDEYGNKFWYKDDKHHRENGPAMEFVNGSKEWYINGKRHRLDGPAYEGPDGTKQWWINDELHRLDGPAVEWSYGDKEWYYQGQEIDCQSQEEFERIINLLAFE